MRSNSRTGHRRHSAAAAGWAKRRRSTSHSSEPKRRNAARMSGPPAAEGGAPVSRRVCERGVAGAHHRGQQQPGQDSHAEAHLPRIAQADLRRPAAGHDVEQARAVHQARHGGHLLQGLRRFHERHVRASRQRQVGAGHGLVQAGHRAGIGACDDHEVRGTPGGDGGGDLGHELVARDDLLAVEVAATLGRDLVFDVQRGQTPHLVLAHRARGIQLIAVASVGVRDHRDSGRGGDLARRARHLRQGQQAVVREPAGGRHACTGHVERLESGLDGHAGGDAVVDARRRHERPRYQLRAQILCCRHAMFPPSKKHRTGYNHMQELIMLAYAS